MTRIRIAHRSDAHVGALHMGRALENGRHTAVEGQLAAMLAFVEQARARDCRIIVNAGDETHVPRPTPDAYHVLGQYHAAREFAKMREFGVEGNHTVRIGESVTSVSTFISRTLAVARTPRVDRIELDWYAKEPPYAELQVAYLPWLARNRVKDADELTEAAVGYLRGLAAQLDPALPSVLITHATIAGAVTSTGFSMGYIPDDLGYKIPVEELAPFTYVAAGHIHRPQRIGPNAAYAGSMFPVDFAEDHEHGWWYVELCDEVDITGPVVPVGTWHAHMEFVPLPTPRVLTYDYTDPDPLARFEDTRPGDLIRIRATVPPQRATSVREVLENAAREFYARGADLVQTDITVERPDRQQAIERDALTSPARAIRAVLQVDAEDSAAAQAAERMIALADTQLEKRAGTASSAGVGTLHLRSISTRNVMRFREANVTLNGEGIVSITGPVGSGKSALFCDVPRLALTGACRMGERLSADLIRHGETDALASVVLADESENRYLITRTFRRRKDGSLTTGLDVSRAMNGSGFEPLTDGKVTSGDAKISEILGGLTDRTLVASTWIVQREADAFTSARPEERKRVLADSAGLSLYDGLAQEARDLMNATTIELARIDAVMAPLDGAEQRHAVATEALEALTTKLAGMRTTLADAERILEQHRGAYERHSAEAKEHETAKATLADLERDAADWYNGLDALKDDLARTEQLLGRRAEIEAAAERATAIRTDIEKVEAELRQATEETERVLDEELAIAKLERNHQKVQAERQSALTRLTTERDAAHRNSLRLDAAECPVIEQIISSEIPACAFIRDAKADRDRLAKLGTDIHDAARPVALESQLRDEIERRRAALPSKPVTSGPSASLQSLRYELRQVEQTARDSARLEDAEKAAGGYRERIQKSEEKLTELRPRIDDAKATVAKGTDAAIAAANAQRQVKLYDDSIRSMRGTLESGERERGKVEAAIEQFAGEQVRYAELQAERAVVAQRADDHKELADAWKRARVLVLDAQVIPAVEQTANEILALSPTGLQLVLERGARDTLDLALVGGLAPTYALASGGQRTWVDVALHVAIALVVAQRVQTRLSFLFIDEPEGLDAPNRAAFGRVLHFIHDKYALTVLAASHHEDLVELVADHTIRLQPGPDGTEVMAA